MLQHENYRSEPAPWVPVASELRNGQQIRQSQVLSNPSEVNALLNGVVSEELSPNKAAVVRQLLSLWLQEAKAQQS